MNPVGKYGLVSLLDTDVEPPFASSPGCFGASVNVTSISEFKSSFVSGYSERLILQVSVSFSLFYAKIL